MDHRVSQIDNLSILSLGSGMVFPTCIPPTSEMQENLSPGVVLPCGRYWPLSSNKSRGESWVRTRTVQRLLSLGVLKTLLTFGGKMINKCPANGPNYSIFLELCTLFSHLTFPWIRSNVSLLFVRCCTDPEHHASNTVLWAESWAEHGSYSPDTIHPIAGTSISWTSGDHHASTGS